MRKVLTAALVGLSLAASLSFAGAAEDKKVVIAYQTGANPYFVGIADGAFAKKTGWNIEFRRFNSGAEIFAAIASGDVQIGDVGSSPFAAAVSKGLDVKAFYISSVSRDGEALVVRPEITSPGRGSGAISAISSCAWRVSPTPETPSWRPTQPTMDGSSCASAMVSSSPLRRSTTTRPISWRARYSTAQWSFRSRKLGGMALISPALP